MYSGVQISQTQIKMFWKLRKLNTLHLPTYLHPQQGYG